MNGWGNDKMKTMAVEIITKDDLEEFRVKLLEELKHLLVREEKKSEEKWLRSHKVKVLLNISTGTLQNLCLNNVLHPTKIGGINYYNAEEIENLLKNNHPDKLIKS